MGHNEIIRSCLESVLSVIIAVIYFQSRQLAHSPCPCVCLQYIVPLLHPGGYGVSIAEKKKNLQSVWKGKRVFPY